MMLIFFIIQETKAKLFLQMETENSKVEVQPFHEGMNCGPTRNFVQCHSPETILEAGRHCPGEVAFHGGGPKQVAKDLPIPRFRSQQQEVFSHEGAMVPRFERIFNKLVESIQEVVQV
jgi:hypothetical protein